MENIFVRIDLVTITELSPQIYNGLQIYLAIKGDMRVDINKVRYILNTNDVLVVNCHDVYSICGDENSIALVLRLPFEYMRRECEDMIKYSLNCYSGGSGDTRFDEVRRLLIYIMMIYSHMDEGYRLNVRACLFQLLHYLLVNFSSGQPETQMAAAGKKDGHIASVLDYINENYKQSITLEELAKREFMSVHYLSRLFKNQVGLGFLDYIGKKRLESAVTDLIYTEESILKIALQNGFANTKSFADVFKKTYEDTPSQFRQRYQKKSASSVTNNYMSRSIEELDGLGELVKYLKLYDEKGEKSVEAKVTDTVIDLNLQRSAVERGKRIIKIGKWSEGLKREVQEELELVQKEIGFDYVHFKGVFADGVFQHDENSSYSCYDYIQTLRFFAGIGLLPFIQIDLPSALGQFHTVEAACGELKRFLLLMSRSFSREIVDKWKFELKCGASKKDGFITEGYESFYQAIKGMSKHIRVGFFLENTVDGSGDFKNELRNVLDDCWNYNCIPDFITFAVDPNAEVGALGISSDAYAQLRGYHIKMSEQLKSALREAGLLNVELYLTRWNTISGQSLLESGSFYRAALISETVLGLDGCVGGLAVWLSEKISEQMGTNGRSVINLFHCMMVKRAAYFVMEACARLGTRLIYRDDNIIVTEKPCGEYVILVSNPCYFNPLYAMDYNFTRLQNKHFNISLESLRPGTYHFKVFRYVMNFSFAINDKSSIHELTDVEIHRFGDADLTSYMENIARPEFSTYEKEVGSGYMLELELPLNAVSLFMLSGR